MKLLMNLNYKLFALYKSVLYNYFLFLWQNSTQRSVRTTLCALLVCSSVLLFQCGDDDDDDKTPETPPDVEITITAEETKVTLPVTAGNEDITITASETSWDVSESIAWLTATKVNNTTLRVSYQENTGEERSGKVTATIEELSLDITVTQRADAEPSFGTSTIGSQTYTETVEIDDLTLPAATGGNGTLTYSLTPALPSGLDFDEDTRILSGTPAAGSATTATNYTLTVTDIDGDTDEFVLSITVRAESTVTADATAVTLPVIAGNHDIRITASETSWDVSESIAWLEATKVNNTTLRVSYQQNTGAERSGTVTVTLEEVSLEITVTQIADEEPAFADEDIDPQVYTETVEISDLTLPAATGGDGTLTYSWNPALPSGLDFDESTSVLSGTPAAGSATPEADYTLTVTDTDGDTDELVFSITVRVANAVTATLNNAILSVTASSTTSSTTMLTLNVDWAATKTASWITSISPASGSGSANAQAIQIDYTANTGSARSATVIFRETTAGASPSLGVALRLTQAAGTPAGLIPVGTLEQLNAIRYDLDTDGKVDDAANAADYTKAFPDVVYETTNTTKYTGYALSKSLDFDVPASYSDATNQTGWTTGTGWEPIGYYTDDTDNATFRGTFDGKGHTISNLFIDRDSDDNIRIGLFGHVNGAMIRSLGLVDPDITGLAGGSANNGNTHIGGIVGWLSFVPNRGSQILGCYVSGGTITGDNSGTVGGIVGWQVGSWIGGCYVSDVDIIGGSTSVAGGITGYHPDGGGTIACYVSGGTTITGGTNGYVGGITGSLGTTGNDQNPTLMACYVFKVAITIGTGNGARKGSLVGWQTTKGRIITCYAGGMDYDKLVGRSDDNLTVIDSYYEDSNASSADDMSQTAQAKTRSALQTPTAYGSAATDIYADWDVDINNTDDDDNIITGKDDPWDFDNGSSYPVLKVDFNNSSSTADDITAQRSALGS